MLLQHCRNGQVKRTIFDNQAILSLNQSLQQLAQQKDLTYLDIHQQLLADNGLLKANYTADGVHINGAAYTIWKKLVDPYVSNILVD